MPTTIIRMDIGTEPEEQYVLHGRGHPNIPLVATDIRDSDLTKVHYPGGPVRVEAAEPGDFLAVGVLSDSERTPPLCALPYGIDGIPNACTTLYVLSEILDFDILPCSDGPTVMLDGGTDLAVCA